MRQKLGDFEFALDLFHLTKGKERDSEQFKQELIAERPKKVKEEAFYER